MALTIFYCWQSDRAEKLCKDFIGIALKDAAKRVAQRRGVEIIIDSDTQNVSGQPPIADTILEKIRNADAFLADMTYVAETEQGKRIPNPNVLAEFGYALKDKGWRRVLFAMNTAFGDPRQLPFDLGHVRFPSTYALEQEKPDGKRREARAQFSQKLERDLEAILDEVLNTRQPLPDIRPELEALVTELYQSRFTANVVVIIPEPKAFILMAPAGALDDPHLDLQRIQQHRHLLLPKNGIVAAQGQDHDQWWAHGQLRRAQGLPNPFAEWRGRLLRPGVVEFGFNIGLPYAGDERVVIDVFALETKLVRRADRGLRFLNQLGLQGPTLVQVILEDVDTIVLNGGPGLGPIRTRHLPLGALLVPDGVLQVGTMMRAMFDRLWLAGGSPNGSTSFPADAWAGYQVNNAYPDV